jgi:hypothetical protein
MSFSYKNQERQFCIVGLIIRVYFSQEILEKPNLICLYKTHISNNLELSFISKTQLEVYMLSISTFVIEDNTSSSM